MILTLEILKDEIQKVILSNLRPPSERRVGLEVETIFYNNNLCRIPVNRGQNYSASDLMGDLLSLQSKDRYPPTYSLEPGGQLEWASSPFVSLHDINSQFQNHVNLLENLCIQHNLIPIDLSVEPLYNPDEIGLINMKKYHLMNDRFLSTGNLGKWMMRNTASVQVNIDFVNKKDAEEMAFVADCLQPFCSLLFSHSPFMNSHPALNENFRLQIWNDTDGSRCGCLFEHGIDTNNLISSYNDYLLKVPAIFIQAKNSEVEPFDGTLGEWLYNKKTLDRLTNENIQSVLHQIFTHVRFKNVLEVRGADRPPFGFELAPAAFWCGLLTAEKTRDELFERVQEWSSAEKLSLVKSSEKLDLNKLGPEGKSFSQWLSIISDYAIQGLDERAVFFNIKSERKYLEPFLEQALSGLWTFKVQHYFKKSGQNIKGFLLNSYSKK
ncbi:MAG: glutamate-cysteine ligase family protein [Candidatus Marinimicrobia bacterium]|jgi:glutamate--cysteine ligase|nr:glutamate-cysteine ligase family protein [Candidatus Neomarinimicrobiota bacterium]